MENYINILNRHQERQQFIDFIEQSKLTNGRKGLFVHGAAGVGKTMFVQQLLKELHCDAVIYNASDVRNKTTLEMITSNVGNTNVLSLFKNKQSSRIVIVMDDIESMNCGDKSGINMLIKLVRLKQPRKSKNSEEDSVVATSVPIICIGNECQDKKIKELMKACQVIHLMPPTAEQMKILLPNVNVPAHLNDLRKLTIIAKLCDATSDDELIQEVATRSHHDDSKSVACKLLHHPQPLEMHSSSMNETDRTMVGLLLHENSIDSLSKMSALKSVPLYASALNDWCNADYFDRITYQKQLWQLGEMTSIVKTFKTHRLFVPFASRKQPDMRFTKVLTKYSAECNNAQFIHKMCQELLLDKHDMFALFASGAFSSHMKSDVVTKLDVQRVQKLLHMYANGSCN